MTKGLTPDDSSPVEGDATLVTEAERRDLDAGPLVLGVGALALGDVVTAQEAGAKAMTLLETVEIEPDFATVVRFAYAKAAAAGGRVEIARRVATRASEAADEEMRAEIEAWVKGCRDPRE